MTAAEIELLKASQADKYRRVEVVVTGCAHSCCGKGWQRRDGYEQTYRGYVDNLDLSEPGTLMLYSAGIGGGLSYVIACRFAEVEDVLAV